MKAITDQRKFIRDIKSLISKNNYEYYFDEQKRISEYIRCELGKLDIRSKADIDRFAEMNTGITEELQRSMERSLQHYRTMQLKSRPSENISKCISLMMDVDSRQFSKMNDDERAELKRNLDELSRIADSFKNLL